MKFSSPARTTIALSFGFCVDAIFRDKQRQENNARTLQSSCSCSPRAFSFTLLLAQDCSVNTLENNPGISDTSCAIVNATTNNALAFAGDEAIGVNGIGAGVQEIIACIPWLDGCKPNSDENTGGLNEVTRFLQTGTLIPSVITSIQFIELDADGAVIQVDDSQGNIEASSGDTFSYSSKSSELDPSEDISTQFDLIPKTAVLFMVGLNGEGDEIRGRFVWEYTNGCGLDEVAITGVEDYSWVSFDQVDRALPEFCPAINEETPAPTPSPLIIDMFPTPPPMIETLLPTTAPTTIDTPVPTESPFEIIPSLPPSVVDTLAPPTSSPIDETPEPSPSPTPFPTVVDTPAPSLERSAPNPTMSPSINVVNTNQPTIPPTTIETPGPTPSPVITDRIPTLAPTVETPQPVIVLPTFAPTRMGQLPSTKMPSSSPIEESFPTFEPSFFETREPSILKSREPTTYFPIAYDGYGNYGYGNKGYGYAYSDVEYDIDEYDESSKSGKSRQSPVGRAGKGSKSGKGYKNSQLNGKNGKESFDDGADVIQKEYGYERTAGSGRRLNIDIQNIPPKMHRMLRRPVNQFG